MKKLFTILLCGLFCMANLKAQSGSGTISDPSTTGDQLRTAILAANSGDRIYLTDMVVTTGLNFGGNDIDVVLASPDGNPVTITFSNPFTNSANGPFGLNFHGIMNVTLEFENVAINGSGIISAIRFSPPTVMNPYTPSAGVLTLIGANISNGRHGTNGGAVHVDHGSVVIENSTLTNNSAGANGGAVFVRCGTATITNSTFTGNTSHFNGGAVLVGAHGPNNPWPYFPGMGVVTITGSTFENNTATNGFGGGVMADGNIFMTDTEFIGNSANFAGNGWASNNVTQYDEVDHAIFLVTNRPVLTWFTDLATAVAAAESGETIRIYPGEYEINETIFIETPGLKLIGAVDSSGDPVTTIKAADVFTVISNMGSRRFLLSIEADDVLIENIIFDGRGVAVTPDPPSLALTGNLHLRGINAYCAAGVVIDNCVVKNVLAGLILNGTACPVTISVSNFTATENMGWGYGIGVNDNTSISIGENVNAVIFPIALFGLQRAGTTTREMFPTLAAALAAAAVNDAIFLPEGDVEINETIFIETPGLKLIGAVDSSGDPVTTIKAADVFTVISNMGSRRFLLSIEADDVLIENIIFDGRGVAVTPDPPSLALTGNLHLRGINAYCAVRVVIDNCVVKNVLAGLILNGINCLTSVSVSNFTATENMGWGYGIGVNDASLLVGENVDAIIIHNGNFPTINFNYYEIAASGTPVALRDLDIDEVFGINFYLTGNSGLASAFAFITVDVAGPSGANVTHELHIGGGNWVSVLNQPNGIGSGQLGSAAPGGLVSGGWLRFSADQGGDYQITYTLWDLGPGNNAWPSPSAVALAMASTTITVVAHVVTFVSDCETNIPEQIVGLSGIATEPTAPTRIGFTFEGWYTDSIAGSLWDFDIDLVTSDTTLFARWDTITYTVVFNALGGTPVPPNQTINHGDLATEPAALTRTGFTFDGWYTDSIAGSPWDFSTDVVISDTVLFARWVQQYTIITAANNSTLGTTAGDGTGFLEGQVIPLTATPNTGFVFMNWTIGGVVVSTDPSFAYTITDESAIETTVIANFGLLFEDFVSVRWGSTFTLNMVALGGLNITVNSCQWLSNDVLIHTGLNYSAGNTMNALLPNGEYRFVLQTGSGVIPSTVFQGVAPQTASLMGYPNPVISGQTFTVDGVTMGTRIEIFNQMGVLVISTVANSDQATIDIDLPVGIYFLRTEENGTMTIIVNN